MEFVLVDGRTKIVFLPVTRETRVGKVTIIRITMTDDELIVEPSMTVTSEELEAVVAGIEALL